MRKSKKAGLEFMVIRFAIFPGGKTVWARYCITCDALLGAISNKRKPWKTGRPTKKQKEVLATLPPCIQCSPHTQ